MCEDASLHLFGVLGDEGMTLLNSCLSVKEPAYYFNLNLANNSTQFCRFLALQALVECLGICWIRLDLKLPILLNWVRFRPGI